MKVLFVSSLWYGNNGIYCRKAFQEHGYQAELHWGQYIAGNVVAEIYSKMKRLPLAGKRLWAAELAFTNRRLLEKVKFFQPELVVVNCPGAIFPETLQAIKQKEVTLVCWAGDDPRVGWIAPYAMAGVGYYDFYLIGDKTWYSPELREAGARNVHYLPYAADPTVFKPLATNDNERAAYGSKIAHLGVLHTNRPEILRELALRDLALWGAVSFKSFASQSVPKELRPSIRSGRVGAAKANKIYNYSEIVLNLHHPQLGTGYNVKTFEIAASGAFQLSNARDRSDDLYVPGEEIVLFRDTKELKYLIDYYSRNEAERGLVSKRAYDRTVKFHTYGNRISTILEVVAAG